MMQDEPAWRDFLDALAAFYPPGQAARAQSSFPPHRTRRKCSS
jgi:hypothetical protein